MLLTYLMVLIRCSYEIILISITDNPFFDNRTGYSDDLMCSHIRLFSQTGKFVVRGTDFLSTSTRFMWCERKLGQKCIVKVIFDSFQGRKYSILAEIHFFEIYTWPGTHLKTSFEIFCGGIVVSISCFRRVEFNDGSYTDNLL